MMRNAFTGARAPAKCGRPSNWGQISKQQPHNRQRDDWRCHSCDQGDGWEETVCQILSCFRSVCRIDLSTIKSWTTGNLRSGAIVTVDLRKERKNVAQARRGSPLMTMAQAPHLRTMQLHCQLIGDTSQPSFVCSGVCSLSVRRAVAIESSQVPSYKNSCQ